MSGTLRIATVAELTGVAEPTLRAWERRYGVPTPERTASGYRLYGEAEVAQVREMRRLCESGMAAAEAARVVRSRKVDRSERGASAEDPYVAAADAVVDAAARFDGAAMDEALRRAIFLGSAVDVAERVLAPALVEVGERWERGEMSVAQEHFATHRIGSVLRDLVRLTGSADAGGTVVLASFADEEHDLALLIVALHVLRAGRRPIILGARTPPSAVRGAVDRANPTVVGLSVTVAPPPARARELVEDYAAACGRVPWIVGGRGAAALAEAVAKHGGRVANDVTEIAETALFAAAAAGGKPRGRSR